MDINKLTYNADRLPFAAKALAVNSYITFLDRYSIIKQIKPEQWDFVITIAGTFLAVSQLNHESITENEKDKLIDTITKSAISIYPDFIEASEDCRLFVDRTYDGLAELKEYQNDKSFLFSDALGGWVIWNLFGHSPVNEDENTLVRVTGVFIVHTFISWWK